LFQHGLCVSAKQSRGDCWVVVFIIHHYSKGVIIMQRFQQCTQSSMATGMLALMLLIGFSGMAFAGEDTTSDALINVNAATAKQLEKLPGIGKELAKRIVSYRTSNGPFNSVRELVKVRGIGKETLAKIEDLVSTGPSAGESMPDAGESMPDARESMSDTRKSMPDAGESMPDAGESMPDTRKSMPDTRGSMSDAKESMSDTRGSMSDTRKSMSDTREPVSE